MEALSPTAPNELNYALPLLIRGRIQKILDAFYLNKKGLFRPKYTTSRYCPFHAGGWINALCRYNFSAFKPVYFAVK